MYFIGDTPLYDLFGNNIAYKKAFVNEKSKTLDEIETK